MTEALLSSLFTHVDDLRELEPEYFMPNREEIKPHKAEVLPKNPVMILDEGAKKIYAKTPIYQSTVDGPLQAQEFTCTCSIQGLEASGKGKTKKMAKQAASAAVLKLLIRRNLSYAKDLGIPYSSVAEADAYLDASLEQVTETKLCTAEGEAPSDFERGKNYVGMVQELLQKHGSTAIYEDKEEGSGPDLMFTVTCTVEGVTFQGRAKKKKDARAYAAYLMTKHLEKSFESMEKEYYDFVIDEKIETGEEQDTRPSVITSGESMEAILNDKNKFTSYTMNYRPLENKCSFGLAQGLLKIELFPVGEKEPIVRVFPGTGNTQKEAQDQATHNALLLLETF